MCTCTCLLLVHGNCLVRLHFCRSKAARYCLRDEDNECRRAKVEGVLAFYTLKQRSHQVLSLLTVWQEKETLKAFTSGLNLGQPIDKSKGLRRSSSSESVGLHNGDLAPQKVNRCHGEDCRTLGSLLSGR